MGITKSQKTTVGLMAILFFPGVVVHELSHLITAGVLFVRTGEIEFLPKMEGDKVKLGSVAIEKTDPVRRAIIGFAPVVVGLSILLGVVYFQLTLSSFWEVPIGGTTPESSASWRFWTSQNDGVWTKLLLSAITFYLLFAISNTMFSSRKDMEGTLELLIVIVIIIAVFYILGFRIDLLVPGVFIEKAIELLETIDLFLIAPLAIDAFVVGALKIFDRIRRGETKSDLLKQLNNVAM